MSVPYIEPKSIVIGEKLHWKKSVSNYPATLYTLEYRFRGNTGTGFDAEASADGSDFEIEVPASDTNGLTAETYNWQAWLTEIADTDNTFLLCEGSVRVEAGFVSGTVTAVDLRTTAETILAAIQATIANKATKDQLSYKIESGNGSRELRRMTYTELLKAETHYQNLVAREKQAKSVRSGKPFFKNYLIQSKEY